MPEKELVKILDTLAKRRQKRIVTGKVRGGKRSEIITVGKQGKYLKYRVPPDPEKVEDIALLPTIRAAIMHARNGKVEVKKRDFREKVRRRRISTLLCIVLDSSSSMAEPEKVSALRSAMDTIFLDAYQKRDRVALVSAHGHGAEVLSKFTSGVDTVKRVADQVNFGGTTPLSMGISRGLELIKSKLSTEPNSIPIMVILTDGLANTPSVPGGDVNEELLRLSETAKEMGVRTLVVDVDPDEYGLLIAEIFESEHYHAVAHVREEAFASPVYEIQAEKVLAVTGIEEGNMGVLFRNFPENAIDSAIETIRNAGVEIESTGCMYHCDPKHPEEFCRECQLKEELGILSTTTEQMPVEVIDHTVSPEELKGRIYLRFLSVPGVFERANRGMLFIKNVDLLSEEVASIIADVISTGRNVLEKDGKRIEHRVRFSIAGTIGDGEVPGALKDHFVSVVDASFAESEEMKIRNSLYRNEFTADSTGFMRRMEQKKALLSSRMRSAKELVGRVRIPEEMADLFSEDKKGFIKAVAAMNGHSVVDMRDLLEASELLSFSVDVSMNRDEGLRAAAVEGMILPVVNPEIRALFRNFPENAIDSAIETIRNAGVEIESTGCMYHCDPKHPEEFCRECQLKEELGILSTTTEQMPVEVIDHTVSPEELKGRIYLRFLSVPGVFERANRGMLFIKNVDLLSEEVASIIADVISTGRNVLEKDGKRIEHRVRFSIAGTIGDGEVPGALKDHFVSVVDAEAISHDELALKSALNRNMDYRDLIESALKVFHDVSPRDAQLDALVRVCYEMGFSGNDAEIRIMEYARTMAAMDGLKVPDDEHIIRAVNIIGKGLRSGHKGEYYHLGDGSPEEVAVDG